ncbi:MAG: M16 family metallopeptidase, partial [Armatimonadota bacterium]
DRRRDYLALTVNTTSEGVLPALQFLTRYVLEAKFSGADVERARERVLKRRDIWLSSLVEPTEDLLVRAMWNGSAGTALYGEAESLGAIQLADVERFQATVVSRGNTWLSLVGTGDKATAREEAEQALATLPESAAMLSQPRLGLGGQVVVEDNALLDRASLAVGAPLPPFGTREHWAGWLVREMLAGPRGRLYQDRLLAARMGLALPSNLSWEQWPIIALPIQLGRYPYLAVYTLCYPPRVEVAREGILRHLADIGEERFGADEIELARCRVVNQWARELAAPRDRAKLLALAAMLETTLPSPDEVHATVSDIEPHEVAEVARSVVRRASVGIQMPRS